MMSPKRLRRILTEYQARLKELLGDDLDSIALYGSQARGDAVEGADIDVLCVMKRPFDYGELILKTEEISAPDQFEVRRAHFYRLCHKSGLRKTQHSVSDERAA